MKPIRCLVAGALLALATSAQATDDDLRSVSGMQFHDRVLLIFTPGLSDARLTAQRAIMARLAVQSAARDLLLVQVDPKHVVGAHDDSTKLHRRFRVPIDAYRTLLIDKDGHVLHVADGPIAGPAILQVVDRAPARRAEMAQAAAGHPAAPAH